MITAVQKKWFMECKNSEMGNDEILHAAIAIFAENCKDGESVYVRAARVMGLEDFIDFLFEND